MKKQNRMALFCLCLLMIFSAMPAFAQEAPMETAPLLSPDATAEPLPANVEQEGLATDDGTNTVEADASGIVASIEGLTPLYQTKIKAFTANGDAIRMRAMQDGNSEVVCSIQRGETINIYKVYPSYVLAEYEGNVGYIIRTWIDENAVTLDPKTTPPYSVTITQFVATVTETAPIHTSPSLNAPVNPIAVGAGSKVAVLEFVDGFAKVLYWRSYGYIDATLLTDLVVVSRGSEYEPLSEDTPIAAFNSFFAYNTGAEGNDGRCKNIVRTCELMSRVMVPGETLDFNAQVGPYSLRNGYFPAPVLVNGGSKIGSGGGTCQSSSTMYNTIRQLPGITIVYRRPHGPGCARYLPMHQDAAVGSDSLNLIFRNDYEFPIRILAECTGEGSLCIQIFKAE
ncbi:MAG: VanW family protein [Clostridia bacterium]